jgi:hypothetical protein
MGKMRNIWAAGVLGLATGCTIDNAMLEKVGITPPKFEQPGPVQNPLFVPLAKEEKNKVFEAVFQVLDNYGFDIVESNRTDGRIETATRIAPGLALNFKSGSPDFWERVLATTQTYRHRVTVMILDSKQGGMFVDVQVRKELEDLPRPVRSSVGAAIFRVDNDIDRHYEIIDASTPTSGWLYKGRDPAMEQELLRLIRNAL